MAIEEQFYLFWPLLFLLVGTFTRRLIFASALLFIAPFWRLLVVALSGGMQHVNWFRTDLRYMPLMIGCCLALLRYEGKLERLPWLKFPVTAFLACMAVVAGLNRLPHPAVSMIISLIGVAVLINYVAENQGGMVGGFLNSAPLVWIGKLSYSLYLWQQIFCWGSKMRWLGQPPQNILASIILAVLSFYLIEVPFAKARKAIPYFKNPNFLPMGIRLATDDSIASGARGTR